MMMCNNDGDVVPAPCAMTELMDCFAPVTWFDITECTDDVYRRVQGWLVWVYGGQPRRVFEIKTGVPAADAWLNPRESAEHGASLGAWMAALYDLEKRGIKLRQMVTAARLIERWQTTSP